MWRPQPDSHWVDGTMAESGDPKGQRPEGSPDPTPPQGGGEHANPPGPRLSCRARQSSPTRRGDFREAEFKVRLPRGKK